MKKTIAILLALCLCIGLCACSNQSVEKDNTIEITKDNFLDYFFIDGEIQNFEESSMYIGRNYWSADADLLVTIGQQTSGKIRNIEVTIHAYSNTSYWEDNNEDNKAPYIFTVNLPVSGTIEKTIHVTSHLSFSANIDEPVFRFKIVEATGTIELEV